MAGAGPGLHVTVTLKDVNLRDPVPERTVVLKAPTWQVNIGRGTQSGYEGFTPAPDNAWFDSRVMSRSHAILRADPITKEITVEDVGSMHGTHLVGRRLKTHHVEPIWGGDTLTLGADVTRGSSYFNALNITVTWEWSDEGSKTENPRPAYTNMYRNSFSADYNSEDEAYDEVSSEILGDQEEEGYEIYEVEGHISDHDDDVQVVQDSARDPSVEIIIPSTRTFTVPESDDGSTGEGSSLAELSDQEYDESPVSSPIIPSNANETVVKKSKIVTLSTFCSIAPGESASNLGQPSTSQPSAASPADVVEAEEYPDVNETSDADSYAEDELDNEYLDSLKPAYITTTQDEMAEPTGDGPTSSLGATQHQEHVRPPSPSDAAMAKPLGDSSKPVTAAAPPFNSFQTCGAPGVDMATPALRSTSAWAGHNSVLYDPMPRLRTTTQYQPALYYLPTAPYQAPYPPPVAYQAPSIAPSTQPLSPLSIASLVEQQPEVDWRMSRKRKAEEMSSDDFEHGGTSPEPASSEVGENTPELASFEVGGATVTMKDVTTDFATTLPSELSLAMEGAESGSSADIEPPRKKAKTVKAGPSEPRSMGFVKMAAATITGMAIGAVGTIIGLAALPQEYFV